MVTLPIIRGRKSDAHTGRRTRRYGGGRAPSKSHTFEIQGGRRRSLGFRKRFWNCTMFLFVRSTRRARAPGTRRVPGTREHSIPARAPRRSNDGTVVEARRFRPAGFQKRYDNRTVAGRAFIL